MIWYILVILFSAITSISSVSKGALFTEAVKTITLLVSLVILIISCIFITITLSWIHIILIILTYIFTAWISSFLWCAIFYKGKY